MRSYQKHIEKAPDDMEVLRNIDQYEERKWAAQARNAMRQMLLGT